VSDWYASLGEAALGLDVAKADPARVGSIQAPDRRSQRSAGPGTTSSDVARADPGAHPVQTGRPSLKLASRAKAPAVSREAIFRREALEFRVRGRDTPSGVVRLGAPWIRWVYRMTLVLVLVAVAGLWIIHTDESTTGPAIVDGRTGTVTLLLPAAVGQDLASSQKLTVGLPGGRSVAISGLHGQLADDTVIRKAGLTPLAQPAILVTGRLNTGAAAAPAVQDAQLRTQVSVMLGSESLADLLGRQFHAMLSNGTSP
jgi:hypothetical protein